MIAWLAHKNLSCAPASDLTSQAVTEQLAPTRHPCGTRRAPLTAASFRTWQGSWVSVAQDPVLNTTYSGQTLQASNLGQEFNPAIADCGLQGTATSPSSTANLMTFLKQHYYNMDKLKYPW